MSLSGNELTLDVFVSSAKRNMLYRCSASRNGTTLKPGTESFMSGSTLDAANLERCLFNKLTSVFHASVLLLIMNFVITLSK